VCVVVGLYLRGHGGSQRISACEIDVRFLLSSSAFSSLAPQFEHKKNTAVAG
jgi:hypothetical protein